MEQPRAPFRFDFAELRPPPLAVVRAALAPLPAGAEEVSPAVAPAWLPRLLPVFRAGMPLSIEIPAAASAVFAARLRGSLAGILAAAGAAFGVRVMVHPGGLAAGRGPIAGIPARPQVTLIAADLELASVAAATSELARSGPGAWLVLNGLLPALDDRLGLGPVVAGLGAGALHRLPMIGAREVGDLAAGSPAAACGGAFGLASAELAMAVVRRYRELEP